MRPNLHLGVAAAALLAAASPAIAEARAALLDTTGPLGESRLLDEVVVTANRSAQSLERVGQSITVLTEGQIEHSQAVSMIDLLAATPGVSASSNGGLGQPATVRIRGAEGDQTLVVIDGVKLNDPSATGSGYNFGNLLTGDVARVEVLRGAQSTLWGSQAIGGVVNIISSGAERPFEASLDAEAGARGTSYLRGGLGGAHERGMWRVAASHYKTNGVSAFAGGSEDDGYENLGLSGRADLRITERLWLDLRAVYSSAEVDYDGFPEPLYTFADTSEHGTTKDLVAYAGLNLDLFDGRLRNRLAHGYTRTDRQSFNPAHAGASLTFDARGENRRYEYQGVLDIRQGWTTTFGVEHENSEFRSAAPSTWDPAPTQAEAEARLDGAYLQVQGEVAKGLTLTVGLRRDEHDRFGGKTLGQFAAAWSLNDGATVLRASFGQGFKAPSLYQLYSEYGNEALAPEEANGWDFGVQQSFLAGQVSASATWFERRTTNQIDYVSCAFDATPGFAAQCFRSGTQRWGYYDNIAETSARGLELSGAASFGALSLAANYTLTDTTNQTPGPDHGRQLARRPEHMANASATYVWSGGLSTTLATRYASASFDNPSNTARMDAYTLVDLRASYPVNKTVEVFGRIENLTDEVYETTRTYGAPGQGAFVGMRARF